jgi:thioredoxin-like negative regulator of GroEL
MDDPEIVAIQKSRLEKLKKEREEALERKAKGHGEYREIEESEFIDQLNSADHVVVHFYHPDFTRCKIVDKHLSIIARKYLVTKFVKLNVDKSPFFVAKLVVKTLPCIIIFKKAVAVDRIVGFDEVGGSDDFPQHMMERRLSKHAGLVYKPDINSDDEDEEEATNSRAAKGSIYGFTSVDNDDADW